MASRFPPHGGATITTLRAAEHLPIQDVYALTPVLKYPSVACPGAYKIK
jgi:hypothetical protein